jgi:hypothetical protein
MASPLDTASSLCVDAAPLFTNIGEFNAWYATVIAAVRSDSSSDSSIAIREIIPNLAMFTRLVSLLYIDMYSLHRNPLVHSFNEQLRLTRHADISIIQHIIEHYYAELVKHKLNMKVHNILQWYKGLIAVPQMDIDETEYALDDICALQYDISMPLDSITATGPIHPQPTAAAAAVLQLGDNVIYLRRKIDVPSFYATVPTTFTIKSQQNKFIVTQYCDILRAGLAPPSAVATDTSPDMVYIALPLNDNMDSIAVCNTGLSKFLGCNIPIMLDYWFYALYLAMPDNHRAFDQLIMRITAPNKIAISHSNKMHCVPNRTSIAAACYFTIHLPILYELQQTSWEFLWTSMHHMLNIVKLAGYKSPFLNALESYNSIHRIMAILAHDVGVLKRNTYRVKYHCLVQSSDYFAMDEYSPEFAEQFTINKYIVQWVLYDNEQQQLQAHVACRTKIKNSTAYEAIMHQFEDIHIFPQDMIIYKLHHRMEHTLNATIVQLFPEYSEMPALLSFEALLKYADQNAIGPIFNNKFDETGATTIATTPEEFYTLNWMAMYERFVNKYDCEPTYADWATFIFNTLRNSKYHIQQMPAQSIMMQSYDYITRRASHT